jgi:carboxypeptidase PM20D1
MESTPSAGRLSRLIQVPTVSMTPGGTDPAVFAEFRRVLADLYPRTHATLGLELVGGHSLLFHWKGKGPGAPVVLMSHYDVVPARPEGWTHPPFSGALADGRIWGRGTLDTKGSLCMVLEAVETLVSQGFVPARDVWLAFGHDEEVSGTGAGAIARRFQAQGLVPSLVVDEGGAVVDGVVPWVKRPVAMVGVAEKGTNDFVLTVVGKGGHASTPPRRNPAARLARALDRLDRRPLPARVPRPTVDMFRALGPALPWGFLSPLMGLVLPLAGAETNAMVRTTVVATELEGSPAPNVIPARVRANLNVRIAVGESVEGTLARLRARIADPEVELTVAHAGEPSRVSDTHGPAWDLVRRTILAVYPDAVVAPYVMLGASDSRHWSPFCPSVYRFSPIPMSLAERNSIHAVDESIPVTSLESGIAFYLRLLEGLS